MGKKRTASQPTQDAHRAEDQPRPRPGQVRALRRLPGGPVYHLPELAGDDVKWLTLGASERCDLVLAGTAAEADQVEPVHCSLRCTRELVTIEPYAQGAKTEINNVAVVEGHAELRPGNVLTIGPVRLVACGENIKQRPDITAPGLYEMIQQSQELHGTAYQAAAALGVEHRKTFYRWLATGKFKVASLLMLMGAVGGGYWSMRANESDQERPVVRANKSDQEQPMLPAAVARPAPVSRDLESEHTASTPAPEPPKAAAEPVKNARGKNARRKGATHAQIVEQDYSIATPTDEGEAHQRHAEPPAEREFLGFSSTKKPEFLGFSQTVDSLPHNEANKPDDAKGEP